MLISLSISGMLAYIHKHMLSARIKYSPSGDLNMTISIYYRLKSSAFMLMGASKLLIGGNRGGVKEGLSQIE